jgi:hypothetical protein
MMKTYVKKVITGEEKWVFGYDVKTNKPLLTMCLKNLRENRKTTKSSIEGEGDVDCVCVRACVRHACFPPPPPFLEVLFTMNFHLVVMTANSTTMK